MPLMIFARWSKNIPDASKNGQISLSLSFASKVSGLKIIHRSVLSRIVCDYPLSSLFSCSADRRAKHWIWSTLNLRLRHP